MDDLEGVGLAVREFRQEVRLTQQELADLWGVSHATISQIENGRAELKLSREQVARLAEYLEMPAATILYELGFPLERELLGESLYQWKERRRAEWRAQSVDGTEIQQNSARPFGRTLRRSRATQASPSREPGTLGCSTAILPAALHRHSRTSVLDHEAAYSGR